MAGSRTRSESPPPGGAWPETPWSLIRRARSATPKDRRAATARLVELYYVPVRRFFARVLRLGSEDRADDATHDLFAKLLERDFLEGIRHETSFRGFLKVACRRHCATWRASQRASRRALERAASAPERDEAFDAALDEELRRHYVEEAKGRLRAFLRAAGKEDAFAIFEARSRQGGSRPEDYRTLAARFRMRVYDVQNRLAAARKVFRRELLAIARERSNEPRDELRELGLLGLVEP